MKLLEVIRTPQTSDETFDAMLAWGKAMKKTTVSAKDTPGKDYFLTCVLWNDRDEVVLSKNNFLSKLERRNV